MKEVVFLFVFIFMFLGIANASQISEAYLFEANKLEQYRPIEQRDRFNETVFLLRVEASAIRLIEATLANDPSDQELRARLHNARRSIQRCSSFPHSDRALNCARRSFESIAIRIGERLNNKYSDLLDVVEADID